MNFKKPIWRSKKWRDAAKGQLCSMRLPGCNGNPETTVLAHCNGGGMGMKSDDHDAADMCSSCHDMFDGRTKSPEGVDLMVFFEMARYQTIINRLQRGILK